jgi:Virulence-associated protein E
MKPLPAALEPLRALRRWVIWRREKRDGRWTKPPRQALRPEAYASTSEPETWATYEEAAATAARLNLHGVGGGVGFVVWDGNVPGLDLDRCVGEDGTIAQWAWEIIRESGSYAEISPSGTGVRIFGLSEKTDSVGFVLSAPGEGRIEVYRNSKRFLTVTGEQIDPDSELAVIDGLIEKLRMRSLAGVTGAGPTNGDGGGEKDKPDHSTSGIFHKKVCRHAGQGLEPEEIVGLIRKYPKRWDDTKAVQFDKEGRLLDEVKRSYEKWRAEHAAQLGVKWSNGRLPSKIVSDAKIAIMSLGVVCRYDEFHLRNLMEGTALGDWGGEMSDNAVSYLRSLIWEQFKFDPGKDNLYEAVIQLCVSNKFDPVVQYLARVQPRWDGVERLDGWVIRYFGCPDTPLNRAIGRKALIACVRRAREPGAKFDQIIVLEGDEGIFKSSAIQVLAGEPENFSDQSILGMSDQRQQEAMAGRWLYEIADLKGIHYADVMAVKAFASRTEDRARPAYGRCLLNQKRRTVLWATTNDDAYLKGDTGNRRFWPLPCGRIMINWLRRDRDQLWAEAAMHEAMGESLELPRELWGAAKTEQQRRLETHPWMEKLRRVRGQRHRSPDHPGEMEERVASEDLLDNVIGMVAERQQAVHGKQIAGMMRLLGWETRTHRVHKGGDVVKGFRRLLPGATGGKMVVDFDEERQRRRDED